VGRCSCSGRTVDSAVTRDTLTALEELTWIIRAMVDYWNIVPF
jgi:hypothetical protein